MRRTLRVGLYFIPNWHRRRRNCRHSRPTNGW